VDRMFDWLFGLSQVPVFVLLSPQSGQSVLFLSLSFAFMAAVVTWRVKRLSWRAVRRFVLPGRIYLHPSALLDYRFFPVGVIVRTAILSAFIGTSAFWVHLIGGIWPGEGWISLPFWLAALLATLVYVLAFDLGYWFAHWLGHVNPILWQFHKVHHEAEVLTPFTSLRTHPIDDALTMFFTSAATGISFALMDAAIATPLHEWTFFGVNAVLAVYYLTWFNLRHTHHFIIGPKWLGWFVQSPAHHQVHHSVDQRHYDTNLAFGLTVWDRLFGTLYTPQPGERLTMGVEGSIPSVERTVLDLYWQPFRDAWVLMVPGPSRAKEVTPAA
jgi:sterol desaturase/sphingolipid hydroxylase (fatty acid hydroxylase superfamily)